MSAALLLVHGDDGFGLDGAVRDFATEVEATDRADIVPAGSPDEAAIDRARLESGTMSMFGAHLEGNLHPEDSHERDPCILEVLHDRTRADALHEPRDLRGRGELQVESGAEQPFLGLEPAEDDALGHPRPLGDHRGGGSHPMRQEDLSRGVEDVFVTMETWAGHVVIERVLNNLIVRGSLECQATRGPAGRPAASGRQSELLHVRLVVPEEVLLGHDTVLPMADGVHDQLEGLAGWGRWRSHPAAAWAG